MGNIWLLRTVAVLLRYAVSAGYFLVVSNRPEISTPMNSWKRLKEGMYLAERGISPYESDTFHDTPLVLTLLRHTLRQREWLAIWLFILSDLLTSCLLKISTSIYLRTLKTKEDKAKDSYAEGIEQLLISQADILRIPNVVELLYLFSPFAILSCAGLTTAVLDNLLLSAFLCCSLKGFKLSSILLLSLACIRGFYPIALVLYLAYHFAYRSFPDYNRSFWVEFCSVFTWSCVSIASLAYATHIFWGSWDFLEGTLGFILSVPDLTPTVGIFWYFLTEMFDHFRLFFTWVLQLNIFIYLIPLILALRDDSFLIFHHFIMLIAIFKSYPSVGDAALYIALMPALSHLCTYFRNGFVVSCALVATVVLAPIMWYLWIFAGSANANFYFAITLVYSSTQIFQLTDNIYAHLRRQIHLRYGMKPQLDGQPAKVVLKDLWNYSMAAGKR